MQVGKITLQPYIHVVDYGYQKMMITELLDKYQKELTERQNFVDVEMIAEAEGKVEAIKKCLSLF